MAAPRQEHTTAAGEQVVPYVTAIATVHAFYGRHTRASTISNTGCANCSFGCEPQAPAGALWCP
jgi:hypothetical protein